jgi:hypothetical protein
VKSHLITIALGVAFGFCLSRIGFTSWDEVHAMFTFSDLRLVIAFGTAVALLSVGWVVVRRLRPSDPAFSPRPIHKGTLVGGVLFGAGWALTGACPSIALVQLGEGKLGALVRHLRGQCALCGRARALLPLQRGQLRGLSPRFALRSGLMILHISRGGRFCLQQGTMGTPGWKPGAADQAWAT